MSGPLWTRLPLRSINLSKRFAAVVLRTPGQPQKLGKFNPRYLFESAPMFSDDGEFSISRSRSSCSFSNLFHPSAVQWDRAGGFGRESSQLCADELNQLSTSPGEAANCRTVRAAARTASSMKDSQAVTSRIIAARLNTASSRDGLPGRLPVCESCMVSSRLTSSIANLKFACARAISMANAVSLSNAESTPKEVYP